MTIKQDYKQFTSETTSSRKHEMVIVISIAVALPLLFVALDLSKMWAFGDLSPFPTDIEVILNWLIFSWRDEGFGSPNQPVSNYYLVMLGSSVLFGSSVAQKILFMAPLCVSFFGFYYFQRSFNRGWKASLLGALLYSINPITIASIVGGAIGELMTFAIFPIISLFVHKLVSSRVFHPEYIAVVGALTVFVWNPYALFWLSAFILLPVIVAAVGRNYSNLARLIPLAIVVVLVLYPNLMSISNLSTRISGNESSFASTAAYTYSDISVTNLIRLAGNTGSAQANQFLAFNELNSYTVLGFIIPVVAAIPLSLAVSKRLSAGYPQMTLTIVLSISLAFVFILSIVVARNPQVTDINSIFSSLRNPVKLMYPLAFIFAFLFAAGSEIAFNQLKRYGFKQGSLLLCIALAALILVYNYPALDGTAGIKKVRGDQYLVADKYYDLKNLVSSLGIEQGGRIMILPWEYPTYLRIKAEIPNFFGVAPAVGQNDRIATLLEEAFTSIDQNAINKSELLAHYDTKYVVLDKSFGSYYSGQSWYEQARAGKESFIFSNSGLPWLSGNPAHFRALFSQDPNFTLIYEDESFVIFENKVINGKLFTTHDHMATSVEYVEISDNLLSNPSFDEGAQSWNPWPASLVEINTRSFADGNAAILYGQVDWFTNVHQNVVVNGDAWYLLKFTITTQNFTDAHVKVLWSNQTGADDDGEFFRISYVKLDGFDMQRGEIRTIERLLKAPFGATEARIQVLASRVTAEESTAVIVDDLVFVEVKPTIVGIAAGEVIGYEKVSPVFYKAQPTQWNSSELMFVESYNPGWVAKVSSSDSATEYRPDSNEALNKYTLNALGTNPNIELSYLPQQQFYTVTIIGIAALIACLAFLAYHFGVRPRILRASGVIEP